MKSDPLHTYIAENFTDKPPQRQKALRIFDRLITIALVSLLLTLLTVAAGFLGRLLHSALLVGWNMPDLFRPIH